MKKVLILGGGFAGLESAIWLRKYGYDVTLISNRDYMYIYPISIWIPLNDIKFKDATLSFKELEKIHGFKFVQDEVVEIQSKQHKVVCKNNTYSDYDYLVMAIGSGKLKPKGNDNFLSICGAPEESLQIGEKLDELIEKGEGKIAFGFGGNPKDKSAVRGGPAFELMFNVHNKLKKLKIRDKFELIFFAPMPRPGAKMGEKALKMMDAWFERLNIIKHVGKKIKEFAPDGIILEDNSKIEADFTMYIPAGTGLDLLKKSDLPLSEAGFVKVNDYCEVSYDNQEENHTVFAIGDIVAIDGPDWKAKQGHLAEAMARNVAFNIREMDKGSDKRRGYIEHINIICVMDTGDGAALIYRDDKYEKMVAAPVVGHWMKQGWGKYYKTSKKDKMFRIPGM